MNYKSVYIKIFYFGILMSLFGCGSSNYAPLDVVDKVDVNRYIGKWYEIAMLPNSFQKGCNCTTAEYSIIDAETIRVINSCRKDSTTGELDQVNGKAFIVEGSNNAKLRVQFFWPFRGDYWIIDLDKDNYQYAVVGAPSRKYLWILSRTPKMDEQLFNSLVDKCKSKGFDVNKLVKTNQDSSHL
ncbi:MAG: lipocalin family protein [Melioribacteraceae bacterium]